MNDVTTLLPYLKLHFNMEHPCLEECYLDGYESAQAEMPEKNNPYHEGSVEHEHWVEGWWAGFYGEKSLFHMDNVDENQIVVLLPAVPPEAETAAANDHVYYGIANSVWLKILEVTAVVAATAAVGYQVLDYVA